MTVLGEGLSDLFSEEEASLAEGMLIEDRNNVKRQVLAAIDAHKSVFEARALEERISAKAMAETRCLELSTQRHHRVICPACGCIATVQGQPFGKEYITNNEAGEIISSQAVLPTEFSCSACGLALKGYAQLETAMLGDQYTRKTTFTPEEYYGLISPDDVEDYMASQDHYREYDNE